MIAALLAWWRGIWDGAWAGPGHPAHAEMLAEIECEARTERTTRLRWVIDVIADGEDRPMTVRPSSEWEGWSLNSVEVEAAGVSPMPDGRYLRWALFRLHLSRVTP